MSQCRKCSRSGIKGRLCRDCELDELYEEPEEDKPDVLTDGGEPECPTCLATGILDDVLADDQFACPNEECPVVSFRGDRLEPSYPDVLEDAIDTWGEDLQLTIAIEELTELATELARLQRGTGDEGEVIEELADVEIMCDQLSLIFGSDAVNAEIEQQLHRLEQRLEDEQTGDGELIADGGTPECPVCESTGIDAKELPGGQYWCPGDCPIVVFDADDERQHQLAAHLAGERFGSDEEELIADGGEIQPEIGDRVTYIDTDGDRHRALVLDDVPDAEYITVVYGADEPLGKGYNHRAESASSVFPHESLGEEYTADRIAFKPGWDA